MGNLQIKPKQTSENPQEDERESDEREEEEELAASMTFTCEICYEPMLSNNKFNNTSKCVHPFCKECIAKYIQVKVEDGVTDVKCPGLRCSQLLDPMTCRSLLARQVFDKWCDNLCESAVLGFDSRCYCPNRDCSVLVVNECGGVLKREKCPNCKKLFCFNCKVPWHAGYRCEESGQVRDRNDVLFGQLVERMKWARCPQCGQAVERRYGCAYMICRCNKPFCYTCGKAFNMAMGTCGCNNCGVVLCHNMIVLFIFIIFCLLMFCFFSKFV